MSEVNATDLKWEKIRLTKEMRGLLDRTPIEETPITGGKFHVIRQPFGKIIACQSENLFFFHVGDGGRPPEMLPMAITTDAASRLLAPTRRPEDFDECCERLGFRDEEQRETFWKFLLPHSVPKRSRVGSPG